MMQTIENISVTAFIVIGVVIISFLIKGCEMNSSNNAHIRELERIKHTQTIIDTVVVIKNKEVLK